MIAKVEPFIELNTFLKLKNLASTGGQAKILIRSGEILVNGEIETRNRRKLPAGDEVKYKEKVYVVEEGNGEMRKRQNKSCF